MSKVDPQSVAPSADLLGDLLGPLAIEGPPAVPTEEHAIPATEGDPNPADALALAPVDEQKNSVQVLLSVILSMLKWEISIFLLSSKKRVQLEVVLLYLSKDFNK